MMILKRKLFSRAKKHLKVAVAGGAKNTSKRGVSGGEEEAVEIDNPRDANVMVKAGKVGLGAAGALGTGAVIEGGRSLYHFGKAGANIQQIAKDATGNKELQERLVRAGKRAAAAVGEGTGLESVINSAGAAAKSYLRDASGVAKNLKHSTIGRIKLIGNAWRGLQNESVPRFVLLNSEYLTKRALDKVTAGAGEDIKKPLEKVPKLVGNLAKSGLHGRNMKGLGKAAAGLASASGILYVNGRALQDPRTGTKRDSKRNKKDKKK